jgi:hypothetical protein
MYINQVLKNRYGTNLQGQPIFRIVWSTKQLEKRLGTFNEFYGKIFIRTFRGVNEVPKYFWVKDCWVLEKWVPPQLAFTEEIPSSNEGSYEPLFMFRNLATGEDIPIVEQEVHRMIWTSLNPGLPGHRASQMRTEEETDYKKEIDFNKDVLEDANPYLVGKLHSKEAIVRP